MEKEFFMKNIHKFLNIICLSCLLAITILFPAGCNFTEQDPPETPFVVSGKFTKSGVVGSGDVIFKIANKGSYSRSLAPQKVLTNDSYAISGELQDGAAPPVKLKGSYDPYYLTYTVSAAKDNLRYVINGEFYYDGAFRKAAATLLKKDDYTVFRFSVTAQASAAFTGDAVESDADGIPDFALGLWQGSIGGGFGTSTSVQYLISPFSFIKDVTTSSYDGDYPYYETFYRTIAKVIDNTSYYDFISAYATTGGTRYEKCKAEFSGENTRMSIRNYLNGKSLEFATFAAAEAATTLGSPFTLGR